MLFRIKVLRYHCTRPTCLPGRTIVKRLCSDKATHSKDFIRTVHRKYFVSESGDVFYVFHFNEDKNKTTFVLRDYMNIPELARIPDDNHFYYAVFKELNIRFSSQEIKPPLIDSLQYNSLIASDIDSFAKHSILYMLSQVFQVLSKTDTLLIENKPCDQTRLLIRNRKTKVASYTSKAKVAKMVKDMMRGRAEILSDGTIMIGEMK